MSVNRTKRQTGLHIKKLNAKKLQNKNPFFRAWSLNLGGFCNGEILKILCIVYFL